jgi:hypothetical protein
MPENSFLIATVLYVKNASNRLGVMAYALLLGKQRYEN